MILFIARKYFGVEFKSASLLNKILGGGAVMLIIDHWWNNELFLLGENLGSDLFLGVLMTAGAIMFWAGITLIEARATNTAKTAEKTV